MSTVGRSARTTASRSLPVRRPADAASADDHANGAWKRSGATVDQLAKELRLALQYPEGAMV